MPRRRCDTPPSRILPVVKPLSSFAPCPLSGVKQTSGRHAKTTLLTHFDISSDHLLWRTITDKHSLGRLVDTGRRTAIPITRRSRLGASPSGGVAFGHGCHD